MMNKAGNIKENYNELKEEVKAYKQSIYRGYPQVEKFENRKRACIKILLLLLLIYTILRIYTLRSITDYNIFLLALSVFIKVDWILLLAAMTPRWHFSILLYFVALNDGWEFLSSLSKTGISSFEDFIRIYRTSLQQFPPAAASDIVLILYIILTFAAAAWLTLIPQNRSYAEQSEALNLKIKEFTAARAKQ